MLGKNKLKKAEILFRSFQFSARCKSPVVTVWRYHL